MRTKSTAWVWETPRLSSVKDTPRSNYQYRTSRMLWTSVRELSSQEESSILCKSVKTSIPDPWEYGHLARTHGVLDLPYQERLGTTLHAKLGWSQTQTLMFRIWHRWKSFWCLAQMGYLTYWLTKRSLNLSVSGRRRKRCRKNTSLRDLCEKQKRSRGKMQMTSRV